MDTSLTTIRQELLKLIERELTPLAMHYGYSTTPLEAKIKWKPVVLVLGNYSSGKSTLINEVAGEDIQLTGQAPTDDSFTVITHGETSEEREGKVLLSDPQFPFSHMRRHGERFAAHFRFKRIPAESLSDLAIIDTPGMLDSIAEKDRGYDYQEVIGDLASVADLILVLFDPHKAGTIKESHASLRETLPASTYENRVIFVLNRIDECASLEDLLQVYGTLCWNLSQMTGRKDIPRIMMSYAAGQEVEGSQKKPYLEMLKNQRQELKRAIGRAPRHRLDHIASFVEDHSFRLAWMLEGLVAYLKARRSFAMRWSFAGLVVSLVTGAATGFYLYWVGYQGEPVAEQMAAGIAGGVALGLYVLWQIVVSRLMLPVVGRRLLARLGELVTPEERIDRDAWEAVQPQLEKFIASNVGLPHFGEARKQLNNLRVIGQEGAGKIRQAIADSMEEA